MVSVDYSERDMLPGTARPFFSVGGGSGTTFFGAYQATASNLPTQAAVDAVFAGYGVAAGTVGRAQNLLFNSDGTLFSNINPLQNYKGPAIGAASGYLILNNALSYQTSRDAWLIVPMKRWSVFSKLDYEITDDIKFFSQFSYTNSNVKTQIGYTPSVGGSFVPAIPITNPFIPADLRTILASRTNPAAPFAYAKRFNEVGPRAWNESLNTFQVLAGLSGKLDAIDGSWEIYGSHSRMNQVETQYSAISGPRLTQLLNAADGGASLCTGGFNPFGGGGISQSCQNFVSSNLNSLTNVDQNEVQAEVQGKIAKLPAGDLRFAVFGGYRENSFSYTPDGQLARGEILASTATNPSSGKVRVWEIGGELLVPVLADKPFAESLNLDLSYRHSKYNVVGGVNTYSASGDWKFNRTVMLRGGYSRSVRAPNVVELFSSPTAALYNPTPTDPCSISSAARTGATAAQVRGLCLATGLPAPLIDSYTFTQGAAGAVNSGNRNLKPEEADTFTVGTVISPQFNSQLFHRTVFTVDYYDIKLAQAISVLPGSISLNKCFNLDGSNSTYDPKNFYCQFITRDQGNGVPAAAQPFVNLGMIHARGIDFSASNTFDLGSKAGSISLGTNVSYLISYKVQSVPGAAIQNYAGTVNIAGSTSTPPPSLPRWRAITTINYRVKGLRAGATWRYVAGMKDQTSITNPAAARPGVPAYSYIDLSLGYDIGDRFSIDGTLTNVADKQPPLVGGPTNPGVTDRALYDVLGRAFTIRARAKF